MTNQKISLIEELENPPRLQDGSLDQDNLQQVFSFLNSIEGAGYGGMAEFEIARETMRRACSPSSQDGVSHG